jgi:anaerobic C4-dicarboxylate transporter
MQLKTTTTTKNDSRGLGSLKSIFDDLGDFARTNQNLFAGIPIVGTAVQVGAGISQNNVNQQLQSKQQEEYNKYLQAQQNEALSKNIETKNSFFSQNKEIIIMSFLGITIITVIAVTAKKRKNQNSKTSKNKKR